MELMNEGRFVALDENKEVTPRVKWTNIPPSGGSGKSGGINFEELKHARPQRILIAPYWRTYDQSADVFDWDVLTKGSTFMNAHEEVQEAWRDALKCLQHELYRPAVVVLGKAVEGAWIETGISLSEALPQGKPDKTAKTIVVLRDGRKGFAEKVKTVRDLCTDMRLAEILKASGVSNQDLDVIGTWTDIVREARNAIHFDTKLALPNTFDKTTVLFIAAVSYLQKLYNLKKAADGMKAKAAS
jgi:hypothetical protein